MIRQIAGGNPPAGRPSACGAPFNLRAQKAIGVLGAVWQSAIERNRALCDG
jgi:hypothetical protein